MRIGIVVAWFDLWVGAYWDKKHRWLYVLPLPCIGIVFKVPTRRMREPTGPGGFGYCWKCGGHHAPAYLYCNGRRKEATDA